MKTKRLGVNQRRIVSQMKKGLVIKSVYNYIKQTYESTLESECGANIIEDIKTKTLQKLIDRNLFEAETITPSLSTQITTFKLKK